jgi:acyl dehydratase
VAARRRVAGGATQQCTVTAKLVCIVTGRDATRFEAPYTVIARNNAVASSNRMHDDGVAQSLGFRGGLVPGADVWAYMAHPLIEAWGREWLEHGAMEARFQSPFYDGDEVRVEVEPDPDGGDGVVVVRALNAVGTVCASGRAVRRDTSAAPPLDAFPISPLPDWPPPAATREYFESHAMLGTLRAPWTADLAAPYLDSVDEQAAMLRDGTIAPPGWLVRLTDFVLVANVTLGPWIFAQAQLRHHSLVHDGDVVDARARVASLYQRGGHRFVDLDLLFTVGERTVLSGRKTAIYQPRGSA